MSRTKFSENGASQKSCVRKISSLNGDVTLSLFNNGDNIILDMPKCFRKSSIDFGSIGADSLLTDQGTQNSRIISKIIEVEREAELLSFILFSGFLNVEKISFLITNVDGKRIFSVLDPTTMFSLAFMESEEETVACFFKLGNEKYSIRFNTDLRGSDIFNFVWDKITWSENLNEIVWSKSLDKIITSIPETVSLVHLKKITDIDHELLKDVETITIMVLLTNDLRHLRNYTDKNVHIDKYIGGRQELVYWKLFSLTKFKDFKIIDHSFEEPPDAKSDELVSSSPDDDTTELVDSSSDSDEVPELVTSDGEVASFDIECYNPAPEEEDFVRSDGATSESDSDLPELVPVGHETLSNTYHHDRSKSPPRTTARQAKRFHFFCEPKAYNHPKNVVFRVDSHIDRVVITFEDTEIHDERTGESPDYMDRRKPTIVKVKRGQDVVIVYED
jgi:hypothetical protein